MLVWTICRSVWLLKCMNGAGGRWSGRGPGPAGEWHGGGGGFCGRPMCATIHVPTQCSPCCAPAGWNVKSARPSNTAATNARRDRCIVCVVTSSLLHACLDVGGSYRFSVDSLFWKIDAVGHAHTRCRRAIGLVALTAPPHAAAPNWHVTATVAESCSCTIACPCNFGGEPNRNPCEGNRLIAIKSGTTRTSISLACPSWSRSPCAPGRRST